MTSLAELSMVGNVRFISCPEHGSQCSRCWEAVENTNAAKEERGALTLPGIPKELYNVPGAADNTCVLTLPPTHAKERGVSEYEFVHRKRQFNWDAAAVFKKPTA